MCVTAIGYAYAFICKWHIEIENVYNYNLKRLLLYKYERNIEYKHIFIFSAFAVVNTNCIIIYNNLFREISVKVKQLTCIIVDLFLYIETFYALIIY